MRFPTLDEAIACNEAVREPNEASLTAEDDDLDRVAQALDRARAESDPIGAAAALAYEIAAAQGFYEGNKRTALLLARWFLGANTSLDPDRIIPPDDRQLGKLLLATARGDRNGDAIRELLRSRA